MNHISIIAEHGGQKCLLYLIMKYLINFSMSSPVVVIIGRPNVGKSTLFNRMVKTRAAIVEDLPGVTRDRNYMEAEWEGTSFMAVDTGGFYPTHDDDIFSQIKEQAMFAIGEADLIIHLLDGKEGINPFDTDTANILRACGKPVLWAVNKIDTEVRDQRLYDFFRLGIQDIIPVSAATGYNFDELMDKVVSCLPPSEPRELDYTKIAIIGRPNVGKSTMVNALLGKKRMMVSPIAGTTRDSIDSICTYYRRKYLLIDTAGIRRKDTRGYSVERFAVLRALRSIERADVSVLLLDAQEGIVSEDVKIAGLAHKYGKGVILLFNKWDLIENADAVLKKLLSSIKRKLWFFSHAPVLTTSGVQKKRITKVFPIVDEVMGELAKRIKTSELNHVLDGITLPSYKGRRVKIYYITQVDTEPPTFTVFTNIPEGIKDAQIRFLESRIRKKYSFRGTPIRIFKKKRAKTLK
jgi:GTP-binding protein